MLTKALFVSLTLLVTVPALSAATPADDAYDRLFGTESKAAEHAKPKEKLVFARKLLTAAGEATNDQQLQALLCNKAFDFAVTSPDGYPVAADAMGTLVKAQPALKIAADERVLTLTELQFRAARGEQKPAIAADLASVAMRVADAKVRNGDLDGAQAVMRRGAAASKSAGKELATAYDAHAKQLSVRATGLKRIAVLTAKPPDSAGRTELATLLLIEVNRPADALKAATEANDNGLARIATLAALKPTELKPAELKDLADWYVAKAKAASDWGKRHAFQQADLLYTLYLQRDGLSDVDRIAVKLPHAEVEKALRPLLGPEVWISEAATYVASSNDGYHAPLVAFLTCKGALHKGSFAFHTADGNGESVTIDLGEQRNVTRVWIEFRKEAEFAERAKGMSVWLLSKASEKGDKVWTVSKIAKEYDDPLDGRSTRYITIGLPDGTHQAFHLAHAKVFGPDKNDEASEGETREPPKDDPASVKDK